MDIYDPIGKALGLEPIEFNYDIKTYCPDQEIIPWNKGLTKEDQRVRENSIKAANTKKQQGFYKDCGKYLPKLIGDKNHMKSSEHRKRMSELASRRYKKWNEDGSWTWGYRPL